MVGVVVNVVVGVSVGVVVFVFEGSSVEVDVGVVVIGDGDVVVSSSVGFAVSFEQDMHKKSATIRLVHKRAGKYSFPVGLSRQNGRFDASQLLAATTHFLHVQAVC